MKSHERVPVPVKRLEGNDDLPLPSYATDGAAGMDVVSSEERILNPGDRAAVATGLAVAIPEGYEIQIRPRSGLALKHGITVPNTPGTIDSDYRGELKVILINHGLEPYKIRRGDRIAQAVLSPVVMASWLEVHELDETARGEGGFGSTGFGAAEVEPIRKD
ncbi:dUTP diphosphatase [Croceicoccus gelatinilyticus]|uniref:dUTP diphosphatase n=1 Tax=Croceicoccus gelatinilyticus TaxID=2835536 RepID=UPI001BCEEFF2|nr:dUTP diphosphatase [Croceicoccus gelatinilyticus]MBS7670191.1 dUTP diphosphatase [Croceicoccus gelatinilyticus]